MQDVVYNAAGRRYALGRNYNMSRTVYLYDSVLRLANLTQDFPNTGLDLTNTFTYNPANQITELTQSNSLYQYTGNETRTGVYLANGLNQYTMVNGSAPVYDTNGNLTNDNGTLYSYDDENRLRGTSGINIAASTLKYDPLGRLYEITINGTKTTFLYDGDALVAEYNGSNVMTNRYVHGDQVDEPWVQYESAAIGSTNWRFLHADHQGSIVARSTAVGALWGNALSYDSYGIPKATNQGRFGYTGQAWLKELGLFHYKARVYNPKLGRFLQTDPVFYADQMNMYAYVYNDPVNATDPTGMCGPATPACVGVLLKVLLEVAKKKAKDEIKDQVKEQAKREAKEEIKEEIKEEVKEEVKQEVVEKTVRTTRSGDRAVRITRPDGSVKDISKKRVKEYTPNNHPKAPPGTMDKVKFPNAQSGSKGYKRDPTPDELEELE